MSGKTLKMLHSNDYEHWECLEEASIRFIRSKYIDCDNRPSRQDQKPYRLKFTRQTPRKSSNEESTHVFGRDLATLNQSPARLADDVIVSVPFFLIMIVEEIRKHIDLEGILRKAGSLARQNNIIADINKGNYNFTDCNPYDICAVLKRFVRSIPGGLIPHRLRDVFVGALKHYNATKEYDPLLACCLLLDKQHLHVMIYLLRFLGEVAMSHGRNLMDVDNLATVFAPNFFVVAEEQGKRPSTRPNTLLLERVGAERVVVKLLIVNSFRIGYIPRAVEKEANDVRIDNQEMALNLVKNEEAHKSARSFFRSVSSKPRATRLDGGSDDIDKTVKRSNRNRSLFARKKRRDIDNCEKKDSESAFKTPSKSLLRLKRKARLFCSTSEDEKSISRPRIFKTSDVHDAPGPKLIPAVSPTTMQSENAKTSKINTFSLKLSINTSSEGHSLLSCIAESQGELNTSCENSDVKDNTMNVAILADDDPVGMTSISSDATGGEANIKTIRKVLGSISNRSPTNRSTDECNTNVNKKTQKGSKIDDDSSILRSRLAEEPRCVHPDMNDESNPLVSTYNSLNPAVRDTYLHDFMQNVRRSAARTSTITARQQCESASGASWLRTRQRFKPSNRRNRINTTRRRQDVAFKYKGTPV